MYTPTAFKKILSIVSAGFFLLLPLAFMLILALKVYSIFAGPTLKFMQKMGYDHPGMVVVVMILALFVLCFIMGLLMRAPMIEKFRNLIEDNVLRFMPGYEFVKMKLKNAMGADESGDTRAVLVRIDDGWSPAFLMEKIDEKFSTVFVPDVPKSSSGAVYVVEESQIIHLDASFGQLDISIRNFGKGLGKIAREKL